MLNLGTGELTPRERYLRSRSSARAARRLTSRASHVTTWWATVAYPKPSYLTPLALCIALGKPARHFALALRWLGWRRITRSILGTRHTLWLPPSSAIQPRPRGRPRLYDY
jgi:hypothetical protein